MANWYGLIMMLKGDVVPAEARDRCRAEGLYLEFQALKVGYGPELCSMSSALKLLLIIYRDVVKNKIIWEAPLRHASGIYITTRRSDWSQRNSNKLVRIVGGNLSS